MTKKGFGRMNRMNAMYEIQNTIRYGINILTKYTDEESIQLGLDEVRKKLNELASQLSIKQLEENLEYINNIRKYLSAIIKIYSRLGVEICEEEERDYTIEQVFSRHMLTDHLLQLQYPIFIISSALKIVRIAKEELSKYLPENVYEDSEKKLNMTSEDTK